MIIAIDFDGSSVTHEYPRVGKDIGAVPILKRLVAKGHQLMLWTMRGSKPLSDGYVINTLQDAVDWFKGHEIPLWGVNENPQQKASGWSNSNKQHANLFIDDAALGAPLIYDSTISDRPFLDWVAVEEYLIKHNIL